ncbi:MAG TPA: glycosyltransferase family 4 protein [Xanthobacteraceae bacterium]|nr:glycosyltransferase family 4 protein [Xanthobacteraceae bacterium]
MSPPSLRILMTADAVGGVWVYATALARGLAARGHRVTLVTLGPRPQAAQMRDVEDVAGLDVVTTDLALEWMDPAGADFSRACRRLTALERRVAPDIVHLNGFREASATWNAPVLLVAHSCVWSWWRACRGCDPSEPCWSTYAANVRAGLAAAQRWVAPSTAFRDEVAALYAPARAGKVIANGLTIARRRVMKQPIILAAGRLWDEAKNIAPLAAAAPRLAWRLRIAGPLAGGTAGASGRRLAREVSWLGPLPRHELLAEMRHAAIFAAPAVYEPFGLTVLEAASAGCALVLADIPTFRELWEGAALFVDPRDETLLAATLEWVAGDERLRRTLQRRASVRARRYSLDRMCEAYCTLYGQMMGVRPAAPIARRRMQIEARA